MNLTWASFKVYVLDKSLSIQYAEDPSFYYLVAGDFVSAFTCQISKTLPGDADDLADWEDNFKALGNSFGNYLKLMGEDNTVVGVTSENRLKVDMQFSGDQLIKVSSNDQTSGYLEQKITGISGETTADVLNEGAAEVRRIGLPDVGTAGSKGSATNVPVFTTDAKGRVTASTNTPINGVPAANIVNTPAGNIAATDVQAALNELDTDKQALSEKAQANGYASLDGSGKVPVSQLPDTVVGAVDYKGTWNANTNTPNLGASSPDKGDYYVVSVAGTTSLGGISDWQVGDWAIYNGSAWQKVDNTDQVTSVFGRQGLVTAQNGDYNAGQITSTAPSGFAGITAQANINELAALLLAHASRHLPSGSDPLTTAAAVTQTPDQANAVGSANSLARSDHIHAIATAIATALTTSSVNAQGSASSFSRSDHTHAVSIVNSSATATADTTTTSGTDVLMNAMTITPVAGTYLVLFGTSLESNSTNSDVRISIYAGGSQVAHTERWAVPKFSSGGLGGSPNIPIPIETFGIVTVNGSQAIEGRWRRSSGTATAHQRAIGILKLSN